MMRLIPVLGVALAMAGSLRAQALELKPGDNICIVGGTLAERMQHYGWLETYIHARFPRHQLVFRNLGYSGDEVDGFRNFGRRMRSMDFGSHDQWLSGSAPIPQPQKVNRNAPVVQNRFALTQTNADVVFAFYGYGESFAGEAGLADFQRNVADFIQHTLRQKYNGQSAPRVVLFSPIPMEDLGNPHLPSQEEIAATNNRLKMYTQAMAAVAKKQGVYFVDLFTPLAGEKSQSPRSINGIHQTEAGDKRIAEAACLGLFGASPDGEENLNALRAAVHDKNWYWYHRYRATDGFSTYGDRAFLRFVQGQSNYEVLQRELETIDVMTSNRDKVVWAAAQGKKIAPDDSNLQPFIPVTTNKPGPLLGGKHEFLGGADAIKKMTVHKNMRVELVADEAMFPELINPVQMAFDTKGRLWVAAWPTYPHWKPTEAMNDKLLILEDNNGDGKADVCKTFADDLHNPTGFEFWNGGVFVAQGPDLLFLKDTNGDDKYDIKERVVHGLDTADTHHTANSFILDPGGALYFQEGTFHHTQSETPWGPTRRVANGAVFRYEPRQQKFDVYVTFGFANPHGHVFDAWGQDIVVDGTGAVPYHGPLFSSHLDFPNKHHQPPTVYQQRTRPCPAIEILSSSHFPEEHRGNLLVPNVIGFQGILQYKLNDSDSSLGASEVEPILYSSDPNFRPADVEVGPDGLIYFTDWQNPIIGHMQHNLRDPSRDRIHGRVYRVRYEGRDPLHPLPIAGRPVPELVQRLKDRDDRVRYRARIELSSRPRAEVLAAATAALGDGKVYEHFALELLWLHQQHNAPNLPLLKRVLQSPEYRARAAAVRVLAAWRDDLLGLPQNFPSGASVASAREKSRAMALELLREAADDQAPRVRLMAVWAASFLPMTEAYEVLLIAQEHPSDRYLDFLSREVARTLQPRVEEAKRAKRALAFTSPAGARFVLRGLSNDELLQQERNEAVYVELLHRPGLRDEARREAVRGLANLHKKTELRVIMDALHMLDAKRESADVSVVFDLVRQLTGRDTTELATARTELERLATSAKQSILRQIGYVSLINVDGQVEQAWKLASAEPRRLVDFANALPLIPDASVRAALYDKMEPLVHDSNKSNKTQGAVGRVVRIELPGRGTLTLAEVEVYSNDVNVARKGRASQKNTSHGGSADRAIDGNTNGSYNARGQTHTEENTGKPYWEVDLGGEYPIERVVIYNRTDDDLGNRLNNFTLKILDAQRALVFQKAGNPAPKVKAEFPMDGIGPEILVRRAAMNALTEIRGQEAKTFQTLAQFVRANDERAAAIRALLKLPRATWPPEAAPELANVLARMIRAMPVQQRTSEAAMDAFEFADALSTLMPANQAKKFRADLRQLGVRVIKIRTVFEKMAYDKELIAVEAGKPVEFVLENTDLMPHNFVIVRPGALEEIGQLAEANAQKPGFAEQQYIPRSPKILAKSKLLLPRGSEKVSFQVPKEPGVYPFVCTYPGHWRRMHGALYVVPDLDEYLSKPDAYLAANKIVPKDELLKNQRPRTEWKYEDLAAAVAPLDHAAMGHHHGDDHVKRAFGNGKQLFTVANCIACHKIGDIGKEYGPDLTKLDPKLKPSDILKEILDPSVKINEKFQTNVIELGSGQIIQGLVVEENADVIKIVENPLVKIAPIVVKRGDVVARERSKTSIMPKGLLDKLTREEILELVSFLTARGDKNHAIYQGGGHHH